MAEPTSAMTFDDLILEVAIKLGVAYYGADGDEAAQVPTNAHDLAMCKRIVNNGIRMFIHDAPTPNGWRWLRPVASVTLWGDIAVDATNAIATSVHAAGITTLTVPTAAFFPSMELKTITITSVGSFVISEYVSATSIKVTGNASAAATNTWSITADGDYTLPLNFGGQYLGGIEFAADTNRGVGLDWCDESVIRAWRSNTNDNNGDPYLFAVRVMDTGSPRRRWELLTYPQTTDDIVVEFPYMIHFDDLTTGTETPPAPFGHDETIKAACFAVAEKDINDAIGNEDAYYRRCLNNSYRIDAMGAPKRLGRLVSPGVFSGSRIREFRDQIYQRPTVTINA